MDNIVKLNLSNNKIGNLGSEELINYLINNLECCNNYFENVFNKSKSFY